MLITHIIDNLYQRLFMQDSQISNAHFHFHKHYLNAYQSFSSHSFQLEVHVYLIADLITIILNHLDFKNPLCISLFPDSINSKSHHLSLFNSVEYFIKCCLIIYNSPNTQLYTYVCLSMSQDHIYSTN